MLTKLASAALALFARWRKGKGAGAGGGSNSHSALALQSCGAVTSGGNSTSLGESLWTAQTALDMAEKLWDMADRQFPTFDHTISVAVKGGPEADLRRIWYLCVSAAFGRYRRRSVGVQKAIFDATWDVTGKAVSCTIGYQDSGLLSAASRALSPNNSPDSGLMLLQQGPDQVTVGGNWPGFLWTVGQSGGAVLPKVFGGIFPVDPGLGGIALNIATTLLNGPLGFWSTLLNAANQEGEFDHSSGTYGWQLVRGCSGPYPMTELLQTGWRTVDVLKELPRGIVGGSLGLPWRRVYPAVAGGSSRYGSKINLGKGAVPLLPDDGRVITTGEKRDPTVQPPKPQLDGISRNSLVQLVAQALQSPCYLPKQVPCQPEVGRESGARLYSAGSGDSNTLYNAGQITRHIAPNTRGVPGSTFSFLLRTDVGPDGYTLPSAFPLRGR